MEESEGTKGPQRGRRARCHPVSSIWEARDCSQHLRKGRDGGAGPGGAGEAAEARGAAGPAPPGLREGPAGGEPGVISSPPRRRTWGTRPQALQGPPEDRAAGAGEASGFPQRMGPEGRRPGRERKAPEQKQESPGG